MLLEKFYLTNTSPDFSLPSSRCALLKVGGALLIPTLRPSGCSSLDSPDAVAVILVRLKSRWCEPFSGFLLTPAMAASIGSKSEHGRFFACFSATDFSSSFDCDTGAMGVKLVFLFTLWIYKIKLSQLVKKLGQRNHQIFLYSKFYLLQVLQK